MGWSEPLTHRQLTLWNLYLDESWNYPSRTDHYLMQIAAEQRCTRTNAQVTLQDVKLPFAVGRSAPKILDLSCDMTAAEMGAIISRQKVLRGSSLGMKTIDSDDDLPEAFKREIERGLEFKRRRDEARARGENLWQPSKRSGG